VDRLVSARLLTTSEHGLQLGQERRATSDKRSHPPFPRGSDMKRRSFVTTAVALAVPVLGIPAVAIAAEAEPGPADSVEAWLLQTANSPVR
jgi:hypothetical protein